MKYEKETVVTLLDTFFHPIGPAVIKDYNAQNQKYLVEYKLPNAAVAEQGWVPQERLVVEARQTG